MNSDRGVARQPWHAVEVAIEASDRSQILLLHDGEDEGVAGEQAVLLAEVRRRGNELSINRLYLDSDWKHFIHGLPETRQLLYLGRMFAQAFADPLGRPTELGDSLKGHDAMGDVAQDVG